MLHRFRYTPSELVLISTEVALLRKRWENSQYFIKEVLRLGGQP